MEQEPLSYEEAIKRAADAIHRFPLKDVQGVPLMSTIADNWKSISEFHPDPSDLLISTYPKAGKVKNLNHPNAYCMAKLNNTMQCIHLFTHIFFSVVGTNNI